MARTITIEHRGQTYYGQIARIENTSLGVEEHGILTAYIHVKGDGWGVGVGGYGLDAPKHDADGKFVGREPTAYGFDHILQMARTVGVDRWEQLPGREVIVLFTSAHAWGGSSVGLAHIQDEKKVFILADHAEEWKARQAPEAVA